ESAASSVAIGMADGGKADTVLPSRTDDGTVIFRSESLLQARRRHVAGLPPDVAGRFDTDRAVLDHQQTRLRAGTNDHQRIRPRAFAGQSEMRRRESIIEAKRQRRLGDDG